MSVIRNRLASAGLMGLRERPVQVSGQDHSGFSNDANLDRTKHAS
jgi:hypothetical protein